MRHMPEQQGMDACQSALAIAYITFITFESFLCVALGNAVPPMGALGGATCPSAGFSCTLVRMPSMPGNKPAGNA